VKLPGWVRRSPELTPPLALSRALPGPGGPDLTTLQNPANEVAFKMIGGAYGVLGAEVLGHFVPHVLDEERWGIYVREAGVAWLCRELAPNIEGGAVGELPLRMARCVAAHHYVHGAVEAAVTRTHGKSFYLDLVVRQSPRHGSTEERLAELCFRSEALSDLDRGMRARLEGPLRALMARTVEGREATDAADLPTVVQQLNTEYSSGMTAADLDFGESGNLMPCFLVFEPHLPEQLASSIRRVLLGSSLG
jgi:hypothetical protein